MGLFGRDARGTQHDALENIVGPSSTMHGTIRSDGGIRIDGTFEGVIEVAGNVVIGEGARVVADITGRNITVGGAVKGNIDGTGRLEILSTGQVFGDIAVSSVMIDEGGLFQGSSRMRGLDQLALAAPPGATGEAPATNPATPAAKPDARTVDVEARPIRQAREPAGEGVVSFDVDEIEPVIPGVVIEDVVAEDASDVAGAVTTDADGRGRNRRRGSRVGRG